MYYISNMSKYILLIEDDILISELYKRQLDLGGMPTDTFATGAEGLHALSQKKYDLILLDIMLPDMNGLQILRSIKQNPAVKSVPVVMLTNLAQADIIKQCFKEGAEEYLLKANLTPKQIIEDVQNLFDKFAVNNTLSESPKSLTI